MSFELRDGCCYPRVVLAVNVALACVDGTIAILAFSQKSELSCASKTARECLASFCPDARLRSTENFIGTWALLDTPLCSKFVLIRIHSRNSQLGWTRQKVFHLLIGSSNMGYFVYFVLALVATCKGWPCWSHSCGFILMACPKILFLAAFLLLLSFWVDLCHQANDEDDEDEECSYQEALLEKTVNKPSLPNIDSHRKCCPLRAIHVGSRQKIVILVTLLVFVLMMASAVLIWIGMGKNPVDSLVVARVYVDLFSTAILLLGGALACYGLLLFLKMSKVRSERASSEMWKVAGLAVVSVVCFTSSTFVALFTDIPGLYHWHQQHVNGVYTSLLLILYYFIGSSVPSAFVLWVMRELPPSIAAHIQEESRTITFIDDSSVAEHHSQRWTTATSSQNQHGHSDDCIGESQETISDFSFTSADIKSKPYIIANHTQIHVLFLPNS